VNNPEPPLPPPPTVEEKIRAAVAGARPAVADRNTSYVHPDVHWWHYQALQDVISTLRALPPDPRIQAAMSYLDRLEVDWRTVRLVMSPDPEATTPPWTPDGGRHHRLDT
jgi:hypothetical protein